MKRFFHILFWLIIASCLLLSFCVYKSFGYNDLDKIPKTKAGIAAKLEKAGVMEARVLLSDDRIKLYSEIFKAPKYKCPICGKWCQLKSNVWVCVCGWRKELPDTYGLIFTPESIQRGKQFIIDNEEILSYVEVRYGVSKEVVTAVTRLETNFGNFLTPKPTWAEEGLTITNSILTWIVHGKWYKRTMYERELVAWLTICKMNDLDPFFFKGSTCGAFGLVQFMPTSYLKWAVDGDGDKRIDLYSVPDAMASCANYLRANGWKQNHSPSWFKTIMTYNADRSYTRAVLKYAEAIKSWKALKPVEKACK
jgi:membrane-bound lytic murein transglycosylase B